MTHILTIFGATGQQGSSIINHITNDTQLSTTYAIRAITRSQGSPQAEALSQHCEIVEADTDDTASLQKALAGSHTVFAMTNPVFTPDGLEEELRSGKAIADAAVAAKAQYIVFSTAPSITEISHGKYTKASHFEAKYQVEQYIRSLPIKSAFIAPGFFMENFSNAQISRLVLDSSIQPWTIKGLAAPNSTWPLVAARDDIGKFVGAILADPEGHQGKTLYPATREYSMRETAQIMSAATGGQVVYQQLTDDEFKKWLPGSSELFFQVFAALAEFGYYGPSSAQLIASSVKEARGKLLTFEEYLQKYAPNF